MVVKVKPINNMNTDEFNPLTDQKVCVTELENSATYIIKKENSASLTRELTFGEKLVGLTFNPSGDEKVNKAKQLCAELADLLDSEFHSKERSGLSATLYEHTMGEILNAQMNVVKTLTLKY